MSLSPYYSDRLQLPAVADKKNGLCGYCKRGLTAQLLDDGRTHYCCPVGCKPWMRQFGDPREAM